MHKKTENFVLIVFALKVNATHISFITFNSISALNRRYHLWFGSSKVVKRKIGADGQFFLFFFGKGVGQTKKTLEEG